jgi:hypothetical protein
MRFGFDSIRLCKVKIAVRFEQIRADSSRFEQIRCWFGSAATLSATNGSKSQSETVKLIIGCQNLLDSGVGADYIEAILRSLTVASKTL